ncbi:tape measure protein, partial [bacterium]|nr:tape measure protein [bacterium]
TTLQTQLRLSSSSAAEASKAYSALFDIAQQGRVSFTELGTTYAAIARSGKELGISQSRLLDVTQSISQAMTIGGGSAASMQAALVQLGQGLSSGTLRGEELN